MTTMTASQSARTQREFLTGFFKLLNEATPLNTDIELDIYFTVEMFVETALLDFEFDALRGFYDQTMDTIEIADALLTE